MDADAICRRLAQLKGLRLVHEIVWRECYDYTFPVRGSGFASVEMNAQGAQDKKAQLLDSTGTDSARILASALMSGLTPANARWFSLEVEGATDEERRWLDESADALWKNIHSANFDAAGFECQLDMAAAGWFPLFVDEAPQGGLRFDAWPLAQVFCASSVAGGPIDIVYREYKITAEQAFADFSEQLSEASKRLAKDKPDDLVDFVHAIYPRSIHAVGALLAKNLPFASCHVEVKQKKLVRESGFHEFPAIIPRWMLIPGSVYATGPAADALPDMKMLNTLSFDELANADLAIAGMWIAEDDGVLNPRTVKVGPRKIVIANSVDSMKELKAGGDWQLAEYLVKGKQAQIRRIFMADQLQPQDKPDMTAYEVHVRVNLIRQLLGPTYGRLQSEYLQRLIERGFGLAYRAGAFNAPPASLANREFSVKYISPLARAQSLEEVSAMDQHETVLMQQAGVRPEVLDTYDWDEASRERGQLLGVPAKLVRSKDDIEAIREARQEAQAAAEQRALAQDVAAGAAPKVIERAVA